MKNLIQAVAITLFAASAAQAQQAVQWRVSDGGNGHWYQLLTEQQATFWQAVAEAVAKGGYLVSIDGPQENSFVRQISMGRFVHFGAYQSPLAPGWSEPGGGWTWVRTDGSVVAPFTIEWSADCNNDGIVDKGQILRGQLADTNADGVPDICQVPTCVDADLFRDFNVNGADLGILLSQWGPNTSLTVSDLNHDGVVDGVDLGIFLSFWGPCP